MTIDDLASFAKLYELKNVSDAAIELSMTQSALSKRVQSMERELNAKLISTKNRRHLIITESGEVLYRYSQTILTQFHLLKHELNEYRQLTKGTLRIGSIPVMSQFDLMAGIDEFMKDYPQINIALEEMEGTQLLDQLQTNQFDLGIVRDVQSRLLNKSQYDFIKLNEDELMVVLPVTHQLANAKQISIDQLKDDDIALLRPGSGIYETVNEMCQAAGFTPNIRFSSTHVETLISVINQKNRATFLFRNSVKNLPKDQYRVIPFTQPIFSILQLVFPQGQLSQAGQRLVSYLKNTVHVN